MSPFSARRGLNDWLDSPDRYIPVISPRHSEAVDTVASVFTEARMTVTSITRKAVEVQSAALPSHADLTVNLTRSLFRFLAPQGGQGRARDNAWRSMQADRDAAADRVEAGRTVLAS
jgi:hypothetical protein